ncbi:MAG: hypothetical protein GY859_07350 [Desulfobacterales bacterium]|nr:hypothetical protein [Desulfobacterales bacterium]
MKYILALYLFLFTLAPGVALAEDTFLDAASSLNNSPMILLKFAILAIVYEVMMTPLFQWRLFCENFEGKGVKTPILIVVALILVWSFDINLFYELLKDLDYGVPAVGGVETTAGVSTFIDSKDLDLSRKFWTYLLTALGIAGGSSGVNTLMIKFGIKDADESKNKATEAQRAAKKR